MGSKITIVHDERHKPIDKMFGDIPFGTVFLWNNVLYAKVNRNSALMVKAMEVFPVGKTAKVINYRPVDLTITVTEAQA